MDPVNFLYGFMVAAPLIGAVVYWYFREKDPI